MIDSSFKPLLLFCVWNVFIHLRLAFFCVLGLEKTSSWGSKKDLGSATSESLSLLIGTEPASNLESSLIRVQPGFKPGSLNSIWTGVQPEFHPGSPKFQRKFNPGSTQVLTQVQPKKVQPRFN